MPAVLRRCGSVASIMLALLTLGCGEQGEGNVVVYTAADRESSAPIYSAFHRHVDGRIQPAAKFAGQSDGAIGLADQIIAQRDSPVADVFWNHEVMQTIRLQRLGLLQPHGWKIEPGYPESMRGSDGSWCGFAARGRVLLVNTDRLPDPADHPVSVDALADPRWQQRCALARPLGGTSGTHAAVIRQIKGEAPARQWFQAVSQSAMVLDDNRAVAAAVASGKVDWGVTDSDEAVLQRDRGQPVRIIFPDQAPQAPGALRIPNTLAMLAGGPNPAAAAELVDYLLTAEVEDRLAMGSSAQLPVSRGSTHRPRVLSDQPVRWMQVDFEAAADDWDSLAKELAAIFP